MARLLLVLGGASGRGVPPCRDGSPDHPIMVKSPTSDTWWLWGDTCTPNGVCYARQSTDRASGTWTGPGGRDVLRGPLTAPAERRAGG
ncbi:hypothetical protein ACF07Y_41375 [Streptomyces sp. NPDC016566]|uniref:hypothetical protein n=1 Tax=Streptomyces sp. NPDC016566 TaxID=3364967 RepID=UPI003702C4D1